MSSNTMDVLKNGVCFTVLSDTRQRWIWSHILNNLWEEGTFKVFDYFLKPDKSYLDIGAWIGPTALYCACKAKHVYAVEPDDAAFQELVKNLELNSSLRSKMTCVNAALTDHSGLVRLYTRTEAGDSLSSVIPTLSYDNFTEVRGITLSDFVTEHDVKDIGFIKMDIEGGEYSLIPSMHDYLYSFRPTLYVSFHIYRLREEMKLKNSNNNNSEGENCLDDQALVLARQVLESLDFYKFIYDSDGKLLNREQVLIDCSDGPFVFTDICWE
ncbi:FkbM family methyltransferase [Desulfosporosinus fructosivorans]